MYSDNVLQMASRTVGVKVRQEALEPEVIPQGHFACGDECPGRDMGMGEMSYRTTWVVDIERTRHASMAFVWQPSDRWFQNDLMRNQRKLFLAGSSSWEYMNGEFICDFEYNVRLVWTPLRGVEHVNRTIRMGEYIDEPLEYMDVDEDGNEIDGQGWPDVGLFTMQPTSPGGYFDPAADHGVASGMGNPEARRHMPMVAHEQSRLSRGHGPTNLWTRWTPEDIPPPPRAVTDDPRLGQTIRFARDNTTRIDATTRLLDERMIRLAEAQLRATAAAAPPVDWPDA